MMDLSADSSACRNQKPTYIDIEAITCKSCPSLATLSSRPSIYMPGLQSNPCETRGSLLLWGNPCEIFFPGGGGPLFGTPSFQLAFTQSALLHLRNRFETLQGCLQDAQNPSKMPPKGRQDPSNYIIHANLVSPSWFNSSFIPLPAF